MGPAKRTLAIVALTTTLVSCSSRAVPASTPTMPAEAPRIYATTATQPLLNELLTTYQHAPPASDTVTNYHGRIEQLYRGEIPYFLTNYLPIDSPLWAAPIAQDGIAIVVHPDVSVRDLTLDQLRAIFQGRVTAWEDFGGHGDIVVFSREEGSGTRAEFESMVMGYRAVTPNAQIAASSQLMIQSIAKQRGAIGYVSLGFLGDQTESLAIEGVIPAWETVVDASYPLRSTIYAVGLEEPQGTERTFLSWVQSAVGQEVVRRRYSPLQIPLS